MNIAPFEPFFNLQDRKKTLYYTERITIKANFGVL